MTRSSRNASKDTGVIAAVLEHGVQTQHRHVTTERVDDSLRLRQPVAANLVENRDGRAGDPLTSERRTVLPWSTRPTPDAYALVDNCHAASLA
ncbi:MAG: hypothetical protein Q8K63_07855 [Acidimicrobiales bacterium]|nr:hypothetical protein [Acidimicrobiales bacterium]